MMRYSILLICLMATGFSACESTEPLYVYEVNEVSVGQAGADKENVKNELEFISLAYADLFGETLDQNRLNAMVQSYESLGDKTLIADILIRNMLNDPAADIPSNTTMRADIEGFIQALYLRLYLREPSAYEMWFLQAQIEQAPDLTPVAIYYAFLTSDEYRFY
ncbi:hypothetical protein [Pontibacter sp. G13]|uniref:hypothetical protein n=1 Tax=Pontibacter sp. G13 TaxID=3074898 RepID=UPI0028897747|nr:hypothetical protein [Pontibacter sp. G13]WNJ17791.1 hypothetical protein RJD25_23310 [Pontibacter sp. G13]